MTVLCKGLKFDHHHVTQASNGPTISGMNCIIGNVEHRAIVLRLIKNAEGQTTSIIVAVTCTFSNKRILPNNLPYDARSYYLPVPPASTTQPGLGTPVIEPGTGNVDKARWVYIGQAYEIDTNCPFQVKGFTSETYPPQSVEAIINAINAKKASTPSS
ncbi:hypothetical protein K466DRAFT_582553 [Polyporus arcularius HHB13444]|uniref:Uncharacterized protein n=1 Tax=Polyporus arcularius HHB13444 TaxID=1314778 RepID=A0A5C3PQL0_9APHY|nr:hypothetical protein K466DRAFT_582553 [Polyporus arcularius HHB13444]